MDNHSRQELLIRSLQERSPRTVAELEVCLGASPATIRRDLTFL
ncbi:MAG: DeoR family transcriptional regulator, partial [Candidatus Methylacidiphilales bacterium]